MSQEPRFPHPIELLLHRPPMLFLDKILAESRDGVRCQGHIGSDFIFLENGKVHPTVLIEFVAQTAGVCVALRDRKKNHMGSRLGFLVGCREAEFYTEVLHLGDIIIVHVTHIWGEVEAGAFMGEAFRETKAGLEKLAKIYISVMDGEKALSSS